MKQPKRGSIREMRRMRSNYEQFLIDAIAVTASLNLLVAGVEGYYKHQERIDNCMQNISKVVQEQYAKVFK